MTPEQKRFIDDSDYQVLLHKWRFSPVGDSIFQGEAGDYYIKVMSEKKRILGHAGAVQASKNVGWD